MKAKKACLLGLVGLLILPVLARSQGQLTACKSNLKNIGTALEMYSTDFGGHYPEKLSLLTPNYLKTLPTCPKANRDTYSEGYISESEPDLYAVYCAGGSHTRVGIPYNYPAYDGLYGLRDGRGIDKDLDDCKQALEQRAACVENYQNEKGALPPDLSEVALSPTSHRQDFLYLPGETDFQLLCPGAHHLSQSGQAFYPRFSGGKVVQKSVANPAPPPAPQKPAGQWNRLAGGITAVLALMGVVGLFAHFRTQKSD